MTADHNPVVGDGYRRLLVTLDPVVIANFGDSFRVLVTRRTEEPFCGQLGLPGAMVDPDKHTDLRDTIQQRLFEKTGYRTALEQVETVGGSSRDPRGWSVSVVYLGLLPTPPLSATGSGAEVEWLKIDQATGSVLECLAFDHNDLIRVAWSRLVSKAAYSTIAFRLVGDTFTLPEVIDVHSRLLGYEINSGSFFRRIMGSGIVIEAGADIQRIGVKGRKPKFYHLRDGTDNFIFSGTLEPPNSRSLVT